jgi:hypothetical protein
VAGEIGLFDDLDRTDRSPAAYGEDSFSFLNRAAGVGWARIRDVLDGWFSQYPLEHAADLRGRFRSKHPGAHIAAWWELYLHRLFARLGYAITVHPEVEGTTKQPDFHLARADQDLYVEAATVFSGIVDEQRDGVREGWIMDAVNRGSNPNFHVRIEFDAIGEKRPRDRDVYRPLEQWLATLDPDAVTVAYRQGAGLPEKTIVIDDWRLRFEAIPVKPEARTGDPGRLLGAGPASGGWVDDKEQLRDTLKHKQGRYGDLGRPLVVAVNCASSFMHDEDAAAALYGSVAVQYQPGAPDRTRTVRLRDGTWIDDRGPRGRRMSAVLTAVQLHPSTVVKVAPQLWHNPWADRPLAPDWPFTKWRCSHEGRIDCTPRQPDMPALLDLPPQWPGPEPPFS